MLLQSNSGIPVRVSPRYVPLTSAFKATLNEFAGKEVFRVSVTHEEISWTPEVKKIVAPAKPRRLTCLAEPRAHDEWNLQMSCRERISNDDYWNPRYRDSHGKRGRNDKYKDRRLRANGSGMTRAVNAEF